MSGITKPQVQSGSPTETKGAAQAVGTDIQNMFQGQDINSIISQLSTPFQRMGASAAANVTGGWDTAKLGGTIDQLLTSPADQTAGLFAALNPIEQQTTDRAVAGTRNLFGTMGGRFSRNVATGEAQTRGQVAQQFDLTRSNALLQANQQRGSVLANLMQAINQASATQGNQTLQALQALLGFAAPQAPVVTPPLLPGLIGAGAQLGAAKILA
jgi:hypothetical protein